MPKFRWEGLSGKGEVVRGEMDATSRDAVITRLRAQRIQPIPAKIRERGGALDRELAIPFLEEKVKTRDVVIFTRQFSTMIDAGLPIVQCLDILSQQTVSKRFRRSITNVKEEVESGATLADSLAKHPKMFDELFVNLVSAGEVGGILDVVLKRLAIYLEKADKLRAKVKGAMIYPASIVFVAVAVTAILLLYVIPVFAELFESFGQTLPAPTQFVIWLSNTTIAYFPYILASIAIFVFLFIRAYKTERGRLAIDTALLRVPIFGDIFRKAAVARFTRTLGTLVHAGVPILDALSITAKTSGNRRVEQAVYATRLSISEGKSISEPLASSGVFPPMVCQMVAVGEATGALDAMLEKIAEFYEDEVDNAIANLTALMEPVIIVFLGVVIGGLVVSMYLPIFQLGAVVGS